MVFGLVLAFLEGRQVTEALSAGLCASFILSSGFVKSIGVWLLQDFGISEYWMPFTTGLFFVIPLLIFVWMLAQIPAPSPDDEARRMRRVTMLHPQRRSFFNRHVQGLLGLLSIYVMLTIVRSLRDDFGVEIWRDLGVQDEPSVFAWSEFWVMIGVVIVNAMAIRIRDNRTAFLFSLGLVGSGFIAVLAAVIGQLSGVLSPMNFMVLLGFGLYVPYVAFHTTVFERMIAAFRETGTVGYLMYLADALGYLPFVAIMVYRNFMKHESGFLVLLIWISVAVACVSMLVAAALSLHYRRVLPTTTNEPAATT